MKLEAGPIPLYFQLEQKLRSDIVSGAYPREAPLPSEEQLCTEYGVSRITVRKAFDSLIQQGLIVRKRGVGTFVTSQQEGVKQTRFVGTLDGLFSYTHALSYRVLARKKIRPPVEISELLELEKPSAVNLELVGLLDDEPFAYSNFYFHEEVGELFTKSDVMDGVPIVRLIEAKTGQRVVRAEQSVEPIAAHEKVAKYLDLEPLTPILHVTRTYYTTAGNPLEVASICYHPERYKYSIELVASGQ